MFPSLIDLPVNLIKCQVRTGTANLFGALKLSLNFHTICQMALKHWKNMQVHERHENRQRNVTFIVTLWNIYGNVALYAINVLAFKG
jgi:hypothetical protein